MILFKSMENNYRILMAEDEPKLGQVVLGLSVVKK